MRPLFQLNRLKLYKMALENKATIEYYINIKC